MKLTIGKRTVAALMITAVGLLVSYVTIVGSLFFWTPPGLEAFLRPRASRPFVERDWKASAFGMPERYMMANDLIASGKLLGTPEKDIRALLGEPASEDRIGSKLLLGFELVSQRQFPTKPWFLPNVLFLNTDTWLLEVTISEGKAVKATIRHT